MFPDASASSTAAGVGAGGGSGGWSGYGSPSPSSGSPIRGSSPSAAEAVAMAAANPFGAPATATSAVAAATGPADHPHPHHSRRGSVAGGTSAMPSECGAARREPEDLYRRLRDLACSSPWIDPVYVLTQLPQVRGRCHTCVGTMLRPEIVL